MPVISRPGFMKIGLISTIGTSAVGLSVLAYARAFEPQNLEIVSLEVHLPRLHPAFDGYRLVQISDVHMGTGITTERLTHIVKVVNAQNPDAVALTGDYVTHGDINPFLPGLVSAFSQLTPKDVAVAILGNHDHWTDPCALRGMIHDSGLTDLNNRVYTVRRGDAQLFLAGVDDYWERQDRLDDVLAQLPGDACSILLAHEPDYADISAASSRFDLQISGHSHGGQVRFPFVNRPLKVPAYSSRYPVGQYQVGTMIQYTNRGVGTIRPALRFNCRPEITVFTLRAASINQAVSKE